MSRYEENKIQLNPRTEFPKIDNSHEGNELDRNSQSNFQQQNQNMNMQKNTCLPNINTPHHYKQGTYPCMGHCCGCMCFCRMQCRCCCCHRSNNCCKNYNKGKSTIKHRYLCIRCGGSGQIASNAIPAGGISRSLNLNNLNGKGLKIIFGDGHDSVKILKESRRPSIDEEHKEPVKPTFPNQPPYPFMFPPNPNMFPSNPNMIPPMGPLPGSLPPARNFNGSPFFPPMQKSASTGNMEIPMLPLQNMGGSSGNPTSKTKRKAKEHRCKHGKLLAIK